MGDEVQMVGLLSLKGDGDLFRENVSVIPTYRVLDIRRVWWAEISNSYLLQ